MIALVIPVEGPLVEVELSPREDGSTLAQLQELVGGYIEALPLPDFIEGADRATAYIDEEGKGIQEPNMRATDFLVPGVGLFWGDYIAGPLVLCGFDPRRGVHAELPEGVLRRARLIEREAGQRVEESDSSA
jgi:Domain of unknown function (DUF3846)